jgi:hypothetical protein
MMARSNVLRALLTDHEAKNEDNRSNGNVWDHAENHGNETRQTKDQVDKAVHDGVSSFCEVKGR